MLQPLNYKLQQQVVLPGDNLPSQPGDLKPSEVLTLRVKLHIQFLLCNLESLIKEIHGKTSEMGYTYISTIYFIATLHRM